MTKDIKSQLKEARDALNNKDFQAAMRASKSVLREDKTNYTAIVFLGIALKEIVKLSQITQMELPKSELRVFLGPSDQAPKAFRKAIELNPTHVLAWQALVNYYENLEGEDSKKELPKCYISLLGIEVVEKKIVEYCNKLIGLSKFGDSVKICLTLFEAIKKCESNENNYQIVKLLTSYLEETLENLTQINPELEKIIAKLIESNFINIKTYSQYLAVLNKQNKYEDLLENALRMYNLFPDDITALTWICKMHSELFIEENELYKKYAEDIESYIDKIFKVEPLNAMALFTQAVSLVQHNKTFEAKENLVNVTSQRPGLLYAWIFLTDVNIKLHLFEDALISWEKADRLLQSINYSNVILKKKSDFQKLVILSQSTNTEDWETALTLYDNIYENDKAVKFLPVLIELKFNLNKLQEAKLLISDLKNLNEELADLFLVKLLKKEENWEQALTICEKSSHDSLDWLLEKGLTYFQVNKPTNCLENLLKAAKTDPNNYLCFLYLGDYYQKISNFDKARRCYEKSFKLNSKSARVGIELSKIYRKSNPEANLALLQSLTTGRIDKNNQWAWLQLGLTYLEQDDPTKAIENLRLVLRVDPENTHCWESLADAYLARGAYSSALKCYQKVLEFADTELYSSLQVANIKKLLGEYAEAKVDFEKILLMNKHYVPALKGLAETTFCQAKQCHWDQRLGSSRDYAQLTVNNVILAIKQRSDLSCLWKLLADACHFVAKLPEKHSCLHVSNKMLEKTDVETEVFLDRLELFGFAQKCYTYSIHFAKEEVFLWHDLATCYLNHSCNTADPAKKTELLDNAMAIAQHCTELNSGGWQHWNLLGNIAISLDPPNFAMAQHAFIKAVTIDPNSTESWTNLGTLYLMKDEIKLANKAFGEGQRANPNYTNSWIGQAMIAELLSQDKEAMDLFRHSTQLGQHQQGSIGYGHWVCKLLLEGSIRDVQRSVYNLHGIPVACDALNFYTNKNQDDGCAWNILGLLNERLGLNRSSNEAFKQAYQMSEKVHRDKAKINYGRLLYKSGDYDKAIDMFQECSEARNQIVNFSSGSGLALAFFKNGQYEESYTAYEQALHWLTDEETNQSDLLVALGSIAYKFQGPDAAKMLLFQSIELKPASVWSLYSTLALGLLHKDWKLAKLVFNELKIFDMQVHGNEKELSDFIKNYSVLMAYFYILNGAKQKAVKELSKMIHKYPNQPQSWHVLSQVLLMSEKKLDAAVNCAYAAMKLGQNHPNMDISKVLCLAALESCVAGSNEKARTMAQKAVHLYPQVPEAWVTLSFVLSKMKDTILPNNFLKNIQSYVVQLRCSEPLLIWCRNHVANL